MKAKYLTALLVLAVFAVPAAVPASQPADIRVEDLRPAPSIAVAPKASLALLARDLRKTEKFQFVAPTGIITHDWVTADPFAQ